MKSISEKISILLTSVVVAVIGILCIIANSAEDSAAFENISLTIGIVLIIVAALALILELVILILAKGGSLLGAAAIANSVLLAIGIYFVANTYSAGSLLALFLDFVPYAMLVVGSLVAVDAVLTLVFGLVNKEETKKVVIAFVIKLVVAALAILLGAIAMGDNWLGNNKFLIFGIVLIVYAVYNVLIAFLAPTFTVKAVIVNDSKKDADVVDQQ